MHSIRTPETKKICARGSCVPVNHTLSDQKTKNNITNFKSWCVCVRMCMGAGIHDMISNHCLGFPLAQSAIFIIFCWNIYRLIIQVQCLKQKRGRKTDQEEEAEEEEEEKTTGMCNKGNHAFSSPRGQSWSLGDVDFMFSWEEIIGFLSVNKGNDDDSDVMWAFLHTFGVGGVGGTSLSENL